jgi:hypothetical protein
VPASSPRPVDLTLHRDWPRTSLRMWTGGEGPIFLPPESIGVEWAGRLGHPSSYALLGGSLAPQSDADVTGGRVGRTLAGRLDTVRSGLLPEYHEAVRSATAGRVHITAAAHGEVGSSQVAFSRVATLLPDLLESGFPESDEALGRQWDASGGTERR